MSCAPHDEDMNAKTLKCTYMIDLLYIYIIWCYLNLHGSVNMHSSWVMLMCFRTWGCCRSLFVVCSKWKWTVLDKPWNCSLPLWWYICACTVISESKYGPIKLFQFIWLDRTCSMMWLHMAKYIIFKLNYISMAFPIHPYLFLKTWNLWWRKWPAAT